MGATSTTTTITIISIMILNIIFPFKLKKIFRYNFTKETYSSSVNMESVNKKYAILDLLIVIIRTMQLRNYGIMISL